MCWTVNFMDSSLKWLKEYVMLLVEKSLQDAGQWLHYQLLGLLLKTLMMLLKKLWKKTLSLWHLLVSNTYTWTHWLCVVQRDYSIRELTARCLQIFSRQFSTCNHRWWYSKRWWTTNTFHTSFHWIKLWKVRELVCSSRISHCCQW